MRFEAVLEYVYVHEASMPLLHPARKVLACESNFKTINVAWQASEAGDSKIRGGVVDFALNPLRKKKTPRMARSALHSLIDISIHFSWANEKKKMRRKTEKIHSILEKIIFSPRSLMGFKKKEIGTKRVGLETRVSD